MMISSSKKAWSGAVTLIMPDNATAMSAVPTSEFARSTSPLGVVLSDGRRRRWRDVENAKMEFITDSIIRRCPCEQGECCIGVGLPDLYVCLGDRQPAECIHVSPWLGDPADTLPRHFVHAHLDTRPNDPGQSAFSGDQGHN
jgi:hypothetical protein